MINLYQNEVESVTQIVQKVSQKYWGKEANGANLTLLHRELIGRLEDAGFVAEVDVFPVLSGMPVIVSIVDRIDEVDFDMEKRQHELQTMDKENELEKRPSIEGNV